MKTLREIKYEARDAFDSMEAAHAEHRWVDVAKYSLQLATLLAEHVDRSGEYPAYLPRDR